MNDVSDKKSSDENLLEKDNSVSTHHKNIQALAIEMFKVKCKLCPETNRNIFMERANNQCKLSFTEQKEFHILDLRYRIMSQKNLNIRNH